MNNYIWTTIFVMAIVSLLIRVIPLTLFRRQIKNQFIRSFLYYVPYITLAIMTFPAILHATGSPIAGFVAFVGGILITWFGGSLIQTSVSCCIIAYLMLLLLYL